LISTRWSIKPTALVHFGQRRFPLYLPKGVSTMKVLNQSYQLSNTTTDDRLVKSGALMFFRALRTVADYASQLPAAATQAASDIAEAWEQSSRPNVR